jgi:hypothetical protein
MKNAIKLFGIIALVAVIGFSMAACGGDDDGGGGGGSKTASGKITSNSDGEATFYIASTQNYQGGDVGIPEGVTVEVTVNSETFTLHGGQANIGSTGSKYLTGLTASTEYNWTAEVSEGTMVWASMVPNQVRFGRSLAQ